MGHYQLSSNRKQSLLTSWATSVLILLSFALYSGSTIGGFNFALVGLVALVPALIKVSPAEHPGTASAVLATTGLLFLVQTSSRPELAHLYYGAGLFYWAAATALSVLLLRRVKSVHRLYTAQVVLGIGLVLVGYLESGKEALPLLVGFAAYQAIKIRSFTKAAQYAKTLPVLALLLVGLWWFLNSKAWIGLAKQVSWMASNPLGDGIDKALIALQLSKPSPVQDFLPEILKLSLDLGAVGGLGYLVLTGLVTWFAYRIRQTRQQYALQASALLILGLGLPLFSSPFLCFVLGLALSLGMRPVKGSPRFYIVPVAAWTMTFSTLTFLQPMWFLSTYGQALERGQLTEAVYFSKSTVQRALDTPRFAAPYKSMAAVKAQKAEKTASPEEATEFAKTSIYLLGQALALEPRCAKCVEQMADLAKAHIPGMGRKELVQAYEKALYLRPLDNQLREKIKALSEE